MEYLKPHITIKYCHGNKYTKNWIGYCKHSLGGFSLSYLYNGGRFNSEREIFRGIEKLKSEGWIVDLIEKVDNYSKIR